MIWLGLKDVISSNLCTGCAACTVACPTGAVIVDEFAVIDNGICKSCNMCSDVCPVVDGYPKDEFDNVVAVYKSRSNHLKGQNGATVTGILKSLFEKGEIDCAIGVERDEEWNAKPVIIKSADELFRIAGTEYTYAPVHKAFNKALGEGFKKIAITGTPCQVHAARRMTDLKKVDGRISAIIGLFCMESFYYDGICKEFIEGDLGMDLRSVKKMDIDKGKLIIYGEEEKSIPVKDMGKYVRFPCHQCSDFSSYYADISVGSVGAPSGWNTLIVRNDKGKKILEKVKDDLELEEGNIEPVKKLSGFKRKSGSKKK